MPLLLPPAASASVYQKTPTQKKGCRISLSVAKEKGEYL